MITMHPQQESTFLQDLQTGLDQFQDVDELQEDLLFDGTRLFRGDALTEPSTALWIGWLGHDEFVDLPSRDQVKEVIRLSVSSAFIIDDDDIDWDVLQRMPRWIINKSTDYLIELALINTIRNQINGHKPSSTEICRILGVLTMYTDRGNAENFNNIVRVVRNLLANLSHEEIKDLLRKLLADSGSKYDGVRVDGFLPKTMHSTVVIVQILAILKVMGLPGPSDLFFGDEEIWAAEQLQTRFRSNFGLYVQRGQADWSDLQNWVEQSQVIPWLHELESRCLAQGLKFRVWNAPSGSIQHRIQTRAWG